MSEVQGTVEFSVELHKFHNVDLFQRGFYQVRAGLRVSPHIPHRFITTTPGHTGECSFTKAGVHDGVVFGRIFQILYRNEEVSLEDRVIFRVHLLLDGERVEEALNEVDFQLRLDLHFTDVEQQLADISSVPVISSRTLGLHFHPRSGLHHHLPVMFDYFHLSVISITVHASLVALHQPLISFARSSKGAWLGKGSPESEAPPPVMSVENLMFGAGYCRPILTEGSFYVASENCLQRAHTWHRTLCRLLLAAYKGLSFYYTVLMKDNPQMQRCEIEELLVEETLNKLTIELQLQSGHEKVAEQISRDLSQLCARLASLWAQFVEAAVPNPHVRSYLAQEHHKLRVRRFSEGYFFTEHPKESSLTFQEELISRHAQMAVDLRSSEYLSLMPPLPIECLDIDGDWNSLPIIFEDRYVDAPCFDYKPHVPNQIGSNTQKSTDSDDTGTHSMSPRRPQSPAVSTKDPASEDFMDLPTYVALIGREKDFVIDREGNMVELESPVGSLDGNTCIDTTETEFGSKVESSADSHQESEIRELDRTNDIEEELSQQCTDRTGLKYIKVRPNDSDPYKGDAVLLIQSGNIKFTDLTVPDISKFSSANHQNSDSEIQTVSEKISIKEEETVLRDTCTESPALTQADGSVDTLLTNSSITDRPMTPPHNTNILPLDHPLSETPSRAGFLGKLKIMKRSSSVISDSGFESEPSSVAWPLDIRTGVAGSRDPLHLCRRRVHRNSLEGLQTESHGSLPSATQASLSSISSLPYEDEDEERQRQLNTLTKSASAPQISSPDNNNENVIQDPTIQGKVVLEASSQMRKKVECGNVADRQEVSNQEMFEEILCKKGETEDIETDTGLISNISEVLLFHKFAKETPDEASDLEDVKDCSGVLHDGDSSLLNENTGLCDNECCEHKMSNTDTGNDPDSHNCDAISFQDIHLSELEDGELGNITDTPNHENQISFNVDSQASSKPSDLKELPTNGREQKGKEGHARTNQVPSSGLAFMNKKVVEVVNLSVSCAPTCLPFSSVLRDSPSVSGLSIRQANSPITHQPLGSFGIISSSSSSLCTEQEISERMINFYKAKEAFLGKLAFRATLYSDVPLLASDHPYFPPEEEEEEFEDGIHLVVCVHGLDGNSADLRLVKTFIELGLPGSRLDFLMSERNQTDTFADFDTMTDRLLDEIIQHIQLYNLTVGRISFIGHSLGNVIIRSVLTRPRFRCYLSKLHTFLSLSGPHLGTLFNNSTLVSTGLWLMQKLKKSGSLLQLTFRDHPDPRQTFLYTLSQKPGLQFFKNVVLVASPQDRYVPFHSARIEMCRSALKDRTTGPVYTEMINNLLRPLMDAPQCRVIRHNVFHALPNTANTLIGRAAHIAVLDSELFLEKFLLVAGLEYFK
ncbi:protein FAM135B isoform X1 [Pangasianodon hypophthalmus]|uniref:protein FAM135B isoform X1 n=1 Tax=Pangasianodon hypophthalmus TaxID=310915 RepID=UPI002307A7A6|nr:protein FAM135B isoform X1 [Pangasianodon hypophthalmus]XP_026765702.3 protein FAM135B isoform X1 [Pangasianodon hypophthalmus]XP_053092815.1 protein FAM135B isoform X1 [Pangasianodon hypophthalmus]